ncbi:hypothetical protein ACQKWADRAFT_231849 [Trichoderma austrokoningii]
MSAEAESGPSDPSKADKGKGVATHTRHVSIDENPQSSGRLRASSSPFTASPLPSRWPSSDAASKHPLPDERKSSENFSSHQSSQSFSSSKANNHQSPTTPVEASSSSSTKGNKEGESSNARLEASEAPHVKEKPRVDHRRRLSSKSHASPRQSSNHLDHPAQSPEDPARIAPSHRHSFNGRPPMPPEMSNFNSINTQGRPPQPFSGNFINGGYGPQGVPFPAPDPSQPVFLPSPMQPSFSSQLPMPNYQVPGLPLSGYELLVARLTGSMTGKKLAPIYRRFEALHHRLLLHMQDELTEMEEQLRNLDAADTQLRKHHGGIHPASRRLESNSSTDAIWRRRDLIKSIAEKLYQYNQVITSFNATYGLPEPSLQEVLAYQSYLRDFNPIVEGESQYLDFAGDLVNLGRRKRRPNSNPPDEPVSPVSHFPNILGFSPPPSSQISNASSSIHAAESSSKLALNRLAIALAVIVLAPIVSFAVIPGFVGRMTVVFLVGLGSAAALFQSGLLNSVAEARSMTDWLLCVGVYGAVMAIIAGII